MIKLEAIVYKTKKNENQDVSPFVLISFTVPKLLVKKSICLYTDFRLFLVLVVGME